MKSERLRLFVAVSVPEEALSSAAAAVEPVKHLWPDARWVDLANQHVTLKFLGWADSTLLPAITKACRAVAASHSPAELALAHLDAFPTRARVRVLWIGLDDPASLLTSLAAALDAALLPLGFPAEERAFTPHLTLARFKAPLRMRDDWPDVEIDASPWPATEVTLWRSHLSPKGARYEVVEEFPLA
jgi:2'-5' RNA ligase